MAEVGYRVIRGPNWPLQDEDGGDGCVGTVVEVGGKGKSTLPRNLVIVHWDMGNRLDHRAGYYGDYDLYVVDTAPAGIKHDGVQCSNKNCGQKHIQGMRWCCLDCSNNYNLCTNCYMFDEHNKAHAFKRIDNPGASGIRVGKRMGTEKMQKRGIFKGSKVMRGTDWRWDDQDGGAGKVGVVLEIQDWKPEFPKTSVKVSWAYAEKQNYRVGYKGKVDLKCLMPGIGGLVYKSHLPVLGEDVPPKQMISERRETLPAKKTEENKKVKEKDLKSFKFTEGNKMKKSGHKKANEKERQRVQKDKPKKVTEMKSGKNLGPARSNLVVQNNGRNIKRDEVKETAERRKKAAAEAVRNQSQKSRSDGQLQTGHSVRILEDKEKVRKLQQGHGHWDDEISKCVGQLAQVLQIDEDGDVEVQLKINGNSKKIIFNPAALRLDTSSKSEESNIKDNCTLPTLTSTSEVASYGSTFVQTALGSTEDLSHIVEVPKDIHLATKGERESAMILVGSAGQGDLAVVERVLDRYPYIIDVKVRGQTALHIACHSGRMDVVDFLLKKKASLTIKDHQEYTALHHSAYGDKQGNTAGLVIFAGANINENGNPLQASPLHLAVQQYNPNVVQVLVQAECDLTLKDLNGDTPLHTALRVGDYDIVLAILSSKRAESVMSVCNKQGANPLIQAVCSRFTPAASQMVETFPQTINATDIHGNTALHYAAVYEDRELAKCLLYQGEKCNLEIRNRNGQTARELAEAADSPVWELLIPSRNQGTSQNANGIEALRSKFRDKALLPRTIEKNGTYSVGDTIQVRKVWTVVAALAHYHGGWTPGMKSVLGLSGEIRDIHDDDGDLDVLMENGLNFRFNSLAVTHGIIPMDKSVPKTTNCGQMSQEQHIMQDCEVLPQILPENVDLSLSDDEDTLGSALFQSIGMRMTWRVKEILERNPDLANHVEHGLSVLCQAARDGSVEIVEELLKKGARVNEKNCYTKTTILFDAAISDTSGETIKLLLQQKDCDPNERQFNSGRTALHAAILRGNIAAFKALVEGGSNLNVQNAHGDTVYHEAVNTERVEMLKILLEDQNVVNVDLRSMFNGDGLNVIHIAAHIGNATIVRMLLEKSPDLAGSLEDNKATPLHIACLKGHFEVVDTLLNTGLCDIYAVDAVGRTALAVLSHSDDDHLISLRLIEEYERKEHGEETRRAGSAVTRREKPHFAIDDVVKVRSNLDLLKTLQKNHGGFNQNMVEALNKQGQILSIRENGDVEVLVGKRQWVFNPAALIPVSSSATAVERTGTQEERTNQKKGPKTEEWLNQQLSDLLSVEVEGYYNLGAAVRFNHLSRVQEILAKKPEKVKTVLHHGQTVLHIACKNGLPEVIKCLLDNGAAVDQPDEKGNQPIHVAATSSRTGDVVRLLTDYGADPNALMEGILENGDIRRFTCLHLAVLTGHTEAAMALVEKGATVNVEDARGDTPFFYAVRQKKNEMVDILLDCADFDPQFSGAGGYTALHHASRLGNEYVIKKLVELYKDKNMDFVNLPSENGSTALLLAAENNKVDATRLLLQTGKCEVNKQKNTGQTPLDVAISNGHRDLADLLRSNGGVTNTSKPEDNINHGPSPSSVLEQPIIASLAESSKQPEDAVSRILNPFNAPDDDDREDFPEQVASSANDNREQERDKSERSSKIEKKQVSEIAPSSTSLRDSTLKQEENHETPATKMVSVEKETIENDKGEQAKLENTIPLPNAFTTDHHDERRTPPKDQCIKCKTAAATVIFLPCNHKITCKDCSRREKSCKTCGTAIKEKTQESVTSAEESGKTSAVGDVSTNPSFEPQDSSTECQICFDNTRAVTFRPCGHCVACSECAKFLVECSICRASITEKVTTILS